MNTTNEPQNQNQAVEHQSEPVYCVPRRNRAQLEGRVIRSVESENTSMSDTLTPNMNVIAEDSDDEEP